LIKAIEATIPTPDRSKDKRAIMHVARSFDINKPGTRPTKLRGGVIGGSIVEGEFNVDDEIVIGPGRKIEKGNKVHYEPIQSKVISMQGGGLNLGNMHAGGLCGMATPLDPAITTADNLSGQVVAKVGDLPEIRDSVDISVNLMKNMVAGEGEDASPIMPLRSNEMLMVNVATATSVGVVSNVKKGKATLSLRLPICADSGQRISLSRRVGSRWRLIGHGTIE
jgi:translation initiation factor 2 subunit 3